MAEGGSKIAGGLYIRTVRNGSHAGEKYIGGDFTLPDGKKLNVRIFKNKKKTNPRHTDYLVYCSWAEDREQRSQQAAPTTGEPPSGGDREFF